ncbi:Response regulator receiver protein [Hyella patelloides LEGE 07179]|uniref:Response regulator receiver protein n=1 Tax=Hyella patelloides LEGE 07179 TaxID=945734 RepID=A0A563VJ65_9CYAN|nr:response regulator [Hyella patelloides]VEP11449.1 Response regulator receiver protein [Hyella patelloides LEGE 07179]
MSKNILIIDDEEDVRSIAQMGLEMAANWNVITASSGEEGLRLAETEQPEIILLDLMMPDWDGKETTKQLKNNQKTVNIPVILMTAKTQSVIALELTELNLAGVITKPFRPLQLSEQISQILSEIELNN